MTVVLLRLVALAVGVWAFADPRFRSLDGALATPSCLPLALAGGLLIVSWMYRRGLGAAALWMGVGILGQAVTLQLIAAGQELRYQHYPPLQSVYYEAPRLWIAILLLQGGIVARGLYRRRARLRDWFSGSLRWWQLGVLGAVATLFSAVVSESISRYVGELAIAGLLQTIHLGTALMICISLPKEFIDDLFKRLRGFRIGIDARRSPKSSPALRRYLLAVSIWVVVAGALLNIFAYQRHPHVPDEVAYLYQARILASGSFTLPRPAVPEAFEVYLMQTDEERWFPVTLIGWPAILALGVFTGLPGLVNPLLAGLCVYLTGLLLRELYDARLAVMATLLLAVSPWFLLMAMNYMTHMSTLACALTAALAVVHCRNVNSWAAALLAGCAVGMASLIRPLEGVILAVLLGLWIVIPAKDFRRRWLPAALFTAGCCAVGGLVLPYNRHLTGNSTRFPIMEYTDEVFGPGANALGFGPDRGMGWAIDPFPGHGPIDGVINAGLNLFSINIELFGWGCGSLLLIVVALISKPKRRSDWLLMALAIGVIAVHFFYYFSGGPDFGARYWFLTIVPCIALTVRGIDSLCAKMEPEDGRRLLVAAGTLSLLSLLTFLPWRAIDKYHHFRGMRPDIRRLTAQNDFSNGLVMIKGDLRSDYASAFIYNPIDLSSSAPIFVRDGDGALRRRVLRAYEDRKVWLVAGPSVTKRGFEILDGPIAASDLLARETD